MPVEAAAVPAEIREKLALVLDLDDLVPAMRLARELRPYFGVAAAAAFFCSAMLSLIRCTT